MTVEFLIVAGETYEKKAAEAERAGDVDAARKYRGMAAKKYAEAAELNPTGKEGLMAKAEELAKAGAGISTAPADGAYGERQQSRTWKTESPEKKQEVKKYEGYKLNIVTPNKKVTFDQIIGLEEPKKIIRQELILPLLHPEEYQRHNLKVGANTLLYGPPGTGKTTFARAVACNVNVPFINVNCNELVDKYIGETGKNVDALFNEVRRFIREQNTAVILFIDELDALAQSRGSDNKTAQEAVPTLIKQLDGLDTDNSGMIIISATNIAEIIDSAVLDRFKSQIYIPLPNEGDRKKMFELKLKELVIDDADMAELDLDYIARASDGLSGRKISQVADKFMRELVERKLSGMSTNESNNDIILKLIQKAR